MKTRDPHAIAFELAMALGVRGRDGFKASPDWSLERLLRSCLGPANELWNERADLLAAVDKLEPDLCRVFTKAGDSTFVLVEMPAEAWKALSALERKNALE